MLRTIIFKRVCKNQNLESKILELNNVLGKDSQNIKALEELGAIYYYEKKDLEAVEIYEKLTQLEPKNSNIWGFLGYLYYELDDLDNAIEKLDYSLDLSPSSPFIYFILGNAYSRAGKIKEAVDSFDFAIFLDFDIYSAHIDFAKKYEDMGRLGRSLREYIAAYEIDSRDKSIKEKIDLLREKNR